MSSSLPSAPSSHSSPSSSAPPPHLLKSQPPPHIPTFSTLLVLQFDISPTPHSNSSKLTAKQSRSEAEGDIRASWNKLEGLLGGSGLRVTCRPGVGKSCSGKEIWVFIGAEDEKISELAEQERHNDFLHSVTSTLPISSTTPDVPSSTTSSITGSFTISASDVSPGDKIRLVHEYLTSAPIQGGLGITPGEGEWVRVRGLGALHDELVNHDWIQSWMGRHWYVGLKFGNDDGEKIRAHFGPDIAIYFSFLSFYTRSLIPLTLFGLVFWLGSKGVYHHALNFIGMGLERWAGAGGPAGLGWGWEWSWVYALGVGIWGVAVTEIWSIEQRKLAVKYGTHRVSRVDRLRPQYISSLPSNSTGTISATPREIALSPTQDKTFLQRELRVMASIPVIVACGVGLGCLLTSVFLFEAFLMHLYDGVGKGIIGFIPTALFIGVIPNIIAAYHELSLLLTNWENHPTKRSYENSLTVKTFAMNAIVAYLGLFLSAYVYVPFGELIMNHFSKIASNRNLFKATSPEAAGLGPSLSIAAKSHIKSDRLVNQVFAYTVTNQVIGLATELGLPYVKRFISQWRNGDSSEKGKKSGLEDNKFAGSEANDEAKFMKKVGYELGLPEYALFGDYAEMVTQFGYVCAWSIVWPLGPLGAFINNYTELRSDAVKICSHARRPVGSRVESIGPWLQTMSFITWLAFVTNSTLVYLFKPSLDIPTTSQSMNPHIASSSFSTYGSTFLYEALDQASNSNKTLTQSQSPLPTWLSSSTVMKSVLPMVIPSIFVALVASHAYLIVKATISYFAEHLLWWGSEEQLGLEIGEGLVKKRYLDDVQKRRAPTSTGPTLAPPIAKSQSKLNRMESTWGGHEQSAARDEAFWTGMSAGNEEIQRALKNV